MSSCLNDSLSQNGGKGKSVLCDSGRRRSASPSATPQIWRPVLEQLGDCFQIGQVPVGDHHLFNACFLHCFATVL